MKLTIVHIEYLALFILNLIITGVKSIKNTQKIKRGWFVHNGLWNNGKATFVGPRPLFLEKDSLYLLMFEKTMSSHCSYNPGALTTFYKPIHSNNHEIIKDIIQNHKNLLSLPDNKVRLDNIKAILDLLYHLLHAFL